MNFRKLNVFICFQPWDPRTDVLQFERNYAIQTKTRHKTPKVAVRTNSVVSIDTNVLAKSKEELLRKMGSVDRSSSSFSKLTGSPRKLPSISATKGDSGESSSPESKSKRKVKKCSDTGDEACGVERRVLRQIRDSLQTMKDQQAEATRLMKGLETSVELLGRNQRELIKSTGLGPITSIRRGIGDQFQMLNRFASLADIVIIVLIALMTQILFNAIANWRQK